MKLLLLLLLSFSANAMHIHSADNKLDIHSDKTIHITGVINDGFTGVVVAKQILSTISQPGDRVVIIDSRGGSVSEGMLIESLLLQEKALTGEKLICIVDGNAMSMAFNLMSMCDVRLGTMDSLLLFHPIYVTELHGQLNAHNLREIARQMEKADLPFKTENMKALHMSSKEYDKNADAETVWSASEMKDRGFLQEIVTLDAN